MDRIGSSNTRPNQSYEPNTCEPPTPNAKTGAGASCPDGSVRYDDGVCADTGLQGPPTATQRYITNLVSTQGPPETTPTQTADQGTETAPSARETVQQLVHEAGTAAMAAVRTAVDNGSIEAGKKIEYALELPNGCKAKFSVAAAIESNASGQPELVAKVSGTIEGKLGALSAEVEFEYSRATSGQETLSFAACVFGGLDQDAAQWVELEAKAGLCGTVVDTTAELPTVEIEAVARAEAGMSLGNMWSWGHELEARTTLSKETLSYDVLR